MQCTFYVEAARPLRDTTSAAPRVLTMATTGYACRSPVRLVAQGACQRAQAPVALR